MMAASAAVSTESAPSVRKTEMLDFDPDVMARAVQDGLLEHVQLERGLFRGQIAHTAAAASRVDWGSYNLSVLARGDLSRDMVTITLALTGHGDWRVHGQGAADGDFVVFPENGEMLATLPPRAEWLSMQVPRGRIEAAGLELHRTLGGGARRMPGLLFTAQRRTLADLAPVLAPHADAAAYDDAQVELAHDELLSVLLGEMSRRGGASDSGRPLTSGERWQVIRRAEAYLESTGEPSVRIDELCLAACTSLSRLERAFRESFGVSPRRFLMLRRLAAVRRELLRRGAQTSITEVATRWGFFHLGRFSQDYRQLFFELPSQTLRAQRAVSPAPAALARLERTLGPATR
jgi:AraC-like DNA-binding protein